MTKKTARLIMLSMILALTACTAQHRKISGDSGNICDPCKDEYFKNYVPCSTPDAQGRKCDLCDEKCCSPGRDRCCCIHRRDDCFKVCVTRRGGK